MGFPDTFLEVSILPRRSNFAASGLPSSYDNDTSLCSSISYDKKNFCYCSVKFGNFGEIDFCFLPHVDIPKDVFTLLVWVVGYETILRFRKPHLNSLVISPIPSRSRINTCTERGKGTIRRQLHPEVRPVA